MNLYLDTSALVKLYVEEPGRPIVMAAVDRADVVGTSIVALVEARAALARRRREHGLAPGAYRRAGRLLQGDWPRYIRFEVTEALVANAANLAEKLHLRAYDAVHLASGLVMQAQVGDTVFACWDQDLARAAAKVGLEVLSARSTARP